MKIYPAVYRRYKNATPVFTHYDVDTKVLKDLTFDIPYIYMDNKNNYDFKEESLLNVYSYLYGKLMSDICISATILVNGYATLALTSNELYTLKADREVVAKPSIGVYNPEFLEEPRQIGLHKTKFKSSFRFSGPGRILYKDSKIFYDDGWHNCPINESDLDNSIKLDRELYRTLIRLDDKYGVIPTKNGLVYI